MVILRAQNLTKMFGDITLFQGVSFVVQERSRLGLVGVNGCGKSTLMRMLCGQASIDGGSTALSHGMKLGYLAQHASFEPTRSLLDETMTVFAHYMDAENALAALEDELARATEEEQIRALVARQAVLHERLHQTDALTFRARTRSTLLGMGFSQADLDLPMSALSGGQLSKAQMAKLLLSGSDILLLDEPTNHLDIQSVEWLESYLNSYPGAMIIISHDRYFLDKVTNGTLELENGHLKAYNGGYSEFLKRKALDREIEEKHYALAQKEIRRMEAMITEFRRWNRERSIRTAESKEKQLNKFKQSAPGRPENAPQALRFSLHADTEGGNDVLICRGLTKTFDRPLFHDIDLHIRRGERVFIIGPNGCGKSTLMRLIMNQVPPDKGEVVFGTRIQPTYYDQHQRSLHMDWTPCKEIENAYPAMNETQVRTVLGSFLFRGDDVFKPVSALSGGERARIELLKMMLSGANFLLLDEPTNHLDAPSREALEEALLDYEGTVLAISHDRYLINRLATRVLVMQNGTLRESIGNYDDYLRHAEEWKMAEVVPEAPKKVPGAGRALRESGAALRRMRAQLRKTEDEIETLEGEIETLEARLADPAVAADYQAILSLTEEIEQRRTLLSQTMQRWEELSLSLDGADEG